MQNELRVEKMALEDQVGTLTVQLNELGGTLRKRLILFIKLHGQCADLRCV